MILTVASSFLGLDIGNTWSDMASFTTIGSNRMKDILDDVWRPGLKGKGETLEELKANMTEAITSALRSMKKESEEWGG